MLIFNRKKAPKKTKRKNVVGLGFGECFEGFEGPF